MSDIMVSIVCTAYNHERYIEKTIQGFLMQKTDFKVEILIHDDHSTDNTAQIIRKYEFQYPEKIHAIYQSENQFQKGISISSILIRKAKGKYIALCEGDDYWIDDLKLKKQVDYLEENNEIAACVHGAYNCYEDGVLKREIIRPFLNNKIVTVEEIISKWLFPTASFVFRREYLPEGAEGIPFWQNAPCGDYPMAVYLALQGNVYYMDELMSVYRNNSISSLSSSVSSNPEKRIQLYDELILLADRINNYTDGKYEKFVYEFKVPKEYGKLLILKDAKVNKQSRYYNDFSRKQKLLLFVSSHMEWLYELYHRLNRIKDNIEYKKCKKMKNVGR